MRQQKKTAAEIFDAAESNGARPVEETDINGDPVPKVLQPGTEVNYNRMIELWDEYKKRYPSANTYDLQTLKHFMDYCVRGWNATQKISRETGQKKKIAYSTVRQRFTEFLAAWQQRPKNDKILPKLSTSMYHYMDTPTFRANVSTEKRVRHYLTVPYFRIFMEHMWSKDWHQYEYAGTQVNDYAKYVFSMYSSSRIGEFIESSARKGSGRGLLYKHMNFVVFRNERGKAETAICPIRDAKGMTLSPEGRPQHGMYEEIEPLFACAMLPALAIALANDAFQDYRSLEEIFDIPPPIAGTVQPLRIKDDMLDLPFFQTFDADGPTGTIEKANAFSNRTVNLGHRAGFPTNITIHCGRREALVKVDAYGYSEAERKKFAGHRCDIFLPSYASSMSTIDGAASYWGLKPRTVYFEAFRGMSLQWHPQMEQSLPAKVQDDLAQRPDFVALSIQIKELGEELKGLTAKDEIKAARSRRDELYLQRRQLMSNELNKWQKLQSRKVTDENSPVASGPSFFNRVRRLDPPRDRLASTLFLRVSLRSEQGRSALRDMIELYKENSKVAYRPSLRPSNGRCPVVTCNQEMETIQLADRWNHIFRCYSKHLKNKYGFVELCFQCDQWITSAVEWHNHCQAHTDNYPTLPARFNQIKFRYTPATAAQCPFCLFNPTLLATVRFKQFSNIHYWKEHINNHFLEIKKKHHQDLDESKVVLCPDPRCGMSFDSVDTLQYHCHDTQSLNLVKFTPRRSAASCTMIKNECKSESPPKGFDDKPQVDLVNEDTETVSTVYIKHFVLQDESGLKRKRGRPKKSYGKLPAAPSAALQDRLFGKKMRGRPKKTRSTASIPLLPIVPKGQSGEERRKRKRRRKGASPVASSSRSATPQSCVMQTVESESEWGASDDDSQSEFDYEPVELGVSTVLQKMCDMGKKRKRKGSPWGTSSKASSSLQTDTSIRSTRSSQRLSSTLITPRTSITSTPSPKDSWNHKSPKSIASKP